MYLMKQAFQYREGPNRKYSSMIRPKVEDTALKNFVSNRYIRDGREVEIKVDSNLIFDGNNKEKLSFGNRTNRSFELTRRNKIQLLN